MNLACRHVFALALAAFLASAASATTVYRTVDRHGAVSFSDKPPAHSEIPAEELHIHTNTSSDENTAVRLEAMRETTDRMAASRMARERHRAELRKLDAETNLSRAALDAPYPQEEYRTYEPLYVAPYRRHHGGHKPRPPLRPVAAPSRSSYPASLIRRHYNPQVRQVFE